MNALSTAVPVAPIEADHLLILLLQLALLLLGALLLGRLAIRLGMPAVVGELCVGILLGPTLLGHVSPAVADWLVPQSTEQFHLLDAIGQVGVLLLVGIAGVELDFGMVQRRRAAAIHGVSMSRQSNRRTQPIQGCGWPADAA